LKRSAIIGLTGLSLCTLAGAFLLIAKPQTAQRTAGNAVQTEKSGQKRTVLPGPPYFTRLIDGQTDL